MTLLSEALGANFNGSRNQRMIGGGNMSERSGLKTADEDLVDYLLWNHAVAEIVFPELEEPGPVYLDLEDEVLEAIAKLLEFEGDARFGLIEAVRGVTLYREYFSLGRILERQRRWLRNPDGPPPCLAFLAMSVLAAQDMGNGNDDISPLAYYPRVATLLGIPASTKNIATEFHRYSEFLWNSLNKWLEELDGLRGTPTAFSLSHRYVGLPLSQALVRAGDRRKFPSFFAQYGLAPGMDLAPEAVERYLDAWFNSETCPASVPLKRQWGRSAARERIAAVAAVELAGWDGVVPEEFRDTSRPFQNVGIMVQHKSGFMDSSFDIALIVRQPGQNSHVGFEVEDSTGRWIPIPFQLNGSNVWRTSYSANLDIESLLEGVVRLRKSDESGSRLAHYPRNIVPLVFDDLQAAYVEQERLQLNVNSMLLVRDISRNQPLADRVADVLKTCARPGFEVQRSAPGLPPTWVAITGVQLFGPPEDSRFNELTPLAQDQLTIAGGMRIPSRVRKWSSLAAPEIRASVGSVDSLKVVLTRIEDESEVGAWESREGSLIVSLKSLGLEDGDYLASLFAGAAKSPIQQVTVRLRSADSVDSGWNLVKRLKYVVSLRDESLGAFSAVDGESDDSDVMIDGPLAVGELGVGPEVRASTNIVWTVKSKEVRVSEPLRIGAADPTSCVVTGAHHLEFPTFWGGYQPKFIEGVCKYCGLVKRTPGWIRSNWKTKTLTVAKHATAVDHLPPHLESRGDLWDAALDALMHMGGGNASLLDATAAQIEGTSLFAALFSRKLEDLGHISVVRNSQGDAQEWEITNRYLAQTSDRSWSLVGFWPGSELDELESRISDRGGRIETVAQDDGPTARFVEGLSKEDFESRLRDMAVFAPRAGSNLLRALPRLSCVETALARESVPGFTSAEKFEVDSGSWAPTGDIMRPGSFRVRRDFQILYIFRSARDVELGTAAPVSVYLAKHLAAQQLGKSLVTYLPDRSSLIVPLGAELPGLYGRAVVAMSGLLPKKASLRLADGNHICLRYSGIYQEAADQLFTLLTT